MIIHVSDVTWEPPYYLEVFCSVRVNISACNKRPNIYAKILCTTFKI
jgi:hypothetical protein